MQKSKFLKIYNFLSDNKTLIALSVSLGGIAALISIYRFEIKFINKAAFEQMVAAINDTSSIPDSFLLLKSSMWLMLVIQIALILVPVFHNYKYFLPVILLEFLIITDVILAIMSFCRQKIDDATVAFVASTFMYYMFCFLMCIKSVYRWACRSLVE